MATSDPDYVKIVRDDFKILSKSYDRINNFMSLGADRQFRYIAVKNVISERISPSKFGRWIDIGTGTGHLANELYRQKPYAFIIAMDISRSMIEYAKDREVYLEGAMNLVVTDAAKTPFRKESFDGGMSGFVGRHFTNYPNTLKEHNRIIRPKGRLMMLEMGRNATPIAFLIDVYVGKVMSLLGKLAAFIVTRGNAPFRLLEETYARFHSPKELVAFYNGAGFKSRFKLALLGSIVIILAYKPDRDKYETLDK